MTWNATAMLCHALSCPTTRPKEHMRSFVGGMSVPLASRRIFFFFFLLPVSCFMLLLIIKSARGRKHLFYLRRNLQFWQQTAHRLGMHFLVPWHFSRSGRQGTRTRANIHIQTHPLLVPGAALNHKIVVDRIVRAQSYSTNVRYHTSDPSLNRGSVIQWRCQAQSQRNATATPPPPLRPTPPPSPV